VFADAFLSPLRAASMTALPSLIMLVVMVTGLITST